MPRSKPRKLVPVGKLAQFADNPDAFRKHLGHAKDRKVAAAGI